MRGLITAVVLGVVAFTAVAASGARGPSVWLAQTSPAVVVGSGFKAGRTVTVSYTSGAKHLRRTVTASSAGQIRAVFGGTTFTRCTGVRLVAGAASLSVRSCASGGRPVLTGNQVGMVSGWLFLPHERVQLLGRVSGQTPVSASFDAGSAGTFTGRVPVRLLACSQVFYRATGSLGSTATFTVPAPECKAP